MQTINGIKRMKNEIPYKKYVPYAATKMKKFAFRKQLTNLLTVKKEDIKKNYEQVNNGKFFLKFLVGIILKNTRHLDVA